MIKVKIHKKKNSKGLMEASIIATPFPVNIQDDL
jgi:hypothetical protein